MATQPEPKCGACHRTAATHAPGCSLIECPHRTPQMWGVPDGAQGFPGQLAEERILRRLNQTHMAVPIDIGDL